MYISKTEIENNRLIINLSYTMKKNEQLTEEYAINLANQIKDNKLEGITILGDDPLKKSNLIGIKYLLEIFEAIFKKHINTYIVTRYPFEKLLKRKYEGLEGYTFDILVMTDILIEVRLKNKKRIIDINETLKLLDKNFEDKYNNGKLEVIESKLE